MSEVEGVGVEPEATEPPASAGGLRILVLLVVLLVLAGVGFRFAGGPYRAEGLNGAVRSVRAHQEALLELDFDPSGADTMRRELEAVRADGGLKGPGFLHPPDAIRFANGTRRIAGLLLVMLEQRADRVAEARAALDAVQALPPAGRREEVERFANALEAFQTQLESQDDPALRARSLQIMVLGLAMGASFGAPGGEVDLSGKQVVSQLMRQANHPFAPEADKLIAVDRLETLRESRPEEVLDALLRLKERGSAEVQGRAHEVLSRIPAADLVAQLSSEDEEARRDAGRVLWERPEDVTANLPTMMAALAQDDVVLREILLRSVRDAGPSAEELAPHAQALGEALKATDDWRVREVAGELLEGVPVEARAPVVASLLTTGSGRGEWALGQVAELGEAGRGMVPAVLGWTTADDEDLRLKAFQILTRFADGSPPGVREAAVRGTEDGSYRVRRAAEELLEEAGGLRFEDVQAMFAAARDAEGREAAIDRLDEVEDLRPSVELTTMLEAGLDDEDSKLAAVRGLRAMVEAHPDYVLGFVPRLFGEKGLVTSGGEVLKVLGEKAAAFRPRLIEGFRHTIQFTIADDMAVLKAIGGTSKDIAQAYAAALETWDATARAYAAQELRKLGADALPAVPALRKGCGDEDARVRAQSFMALAEIGPPAAGAYPEVMKGLDDPDDGARGQAVFCIYRFGAEATRPHAAEIFAKIRPLLDSENKGFRNNAVWAMHSLRTTAFPAIPRLVEMMVGDAHDGAKRGATAFLGEVAEPSPEVRAGFERLVDDDVEMYSGYAKSWLASHPEEGEPTAGEGAGDSAPASDATTDSAPGSAATTDSAPASDPTTDRASEP